MFKRLLTAFWLLTLLVQSHAQQVSNDSLLRRMDSLEAKLNRLETHVVRALPPDRTETRSNLEQGLYGGFVVGDASNTKLTIGGFVQGDFIFDFKQPGNREAFQPSSFPLDNTDKGQVTFTARQTRLSLSSESQTRLGELKTLLEFDLFNPDGSSTPRLRHAWGQLGKWGAGQTWTNFMDVDVYPNILDYQGPNAMIFVRQLQLRFTQPLNKNTVLSLSLENPGSDVNYPADSGITSRPLFPDFTGKIRWSYHSDSHIQLSALLHPVTYDNEVNTAHTNAGWGLNLAGVQEITARSKDNFAYQAAYGMGIARYFNDLGGLGYDGVVKSKTSVELIPDLGLMGFYDHWWSNRFSSTIGYGYMRIYNKDYEPVTNIKETQYGVANLLYYPSSFVKVGLECLYGKKTAISGVTGDDTRVQFSMMYKF